MVSWNLATVFFSLHAFILIFDFGATPGNVWELLLTFHSGITSGGRMATYGEMNLYWLHVKQVLCPLYWLLEFRNFFFLKKTNFKRLKSRRRVKNRFRMLKASSSGQIIPWWAFKRIMVVFLHRKQNCGEASMQSTSADLPGKQALCKTDKGRVMRHH